MTAVDDDWVRIDTERLRRFAAAVMERAGLGPDDAAQVAEVLVYADMRGLASHGVERLPIYVQRLEVGVVKARPAVHVALEDGAIAVVDADNGPGPVAAVVGMRKAMDLAGAHGLGACAVRNSNHCGALAYYTRMAPLSGMIGIGATNANANVVPWGGREAALGTNPLSIAFPTPGDVPLLLDMATSAVARGKIRLAAKNGTPIPEGWALDRAGRATRDARAALEGTLLPMAGPKGYGLALTVDVLCGVLAGSAFGRRIGALYDEFGRPQRVGHFFLALDVRFFMDAHAFLESMREMIAEVKLTPPSQGFPEILLPGEPEARAERDARESGARILRNVWLELELLAARLGVAVPGQPG